MPIYEGSRYSSADLQAIAGADGVHRATVVPTREIVPPSEYNNHRVVEGDRLDTLAAIAYDDPELWWVIADANPTVFYPDDLKPGTLLKIPLVVGEQ